MRRAEEPGRGLREGMVEGKGIIILAVIALESKKESMISLRGQREQP
jgi:hypothetical protein